MHKIYFKDRHSGFMNVILLFKDHRHDSATHVAIFRAVSARICMYIYIYIVCIYHSTVSHIGSFHPFTGHKDP
jgi:hypothetical protein